MSSPIFELDDEHPSVLIGFDVAAWLADLDWSGAAPLNLDESGMFIVDVEHNASQLDAFESRISAGVALFRDRDADGLLDRDSTAIAHAPK